MRPPHPAWRSLFRTGGVPSRFIASLERAARPLERLTRDPAAAAGALACDRAFDALLRPPILAGALAPAFDALDGLAEQREGPPAFAAGSHAAPALDPRATRRSLRAVPPEFAREMVARARETPVRRSAGARIEDPTLAIASACGSRATASARSEPRASRDGGGPREPASSRRVTVDSLARIGVLVERTEGRRRDDSTHRARDGRRPPHRGTGPARGATSDGAFVPASLRGSSRIDHDAPRGRAIARAAAGDPRAAPGTPLGVEPWTRPGYGRRALGLRGLAAMGERAMGERATDEHTMDEHAMGERAMGEHAMDERDAPATERARSFDDAPWQLLDRMPATGGLLAERLAELLRREARSAGVDLEDLGP